MSITRSFLDANVLLAAYRDTGSIGDKARTLLNDPDRQWIASDILRLELIPKAHYNHQALEMAFYEAYFVAATEFIESTPALIQLAEAEAKAAGLSAADSLHITFAKHAGTEEFIAAEKPTKPLFRVTGITVTSIRT